MHQLWTILFAIFALISLAAYLRAFRGMSKVPRLRDVTPLDDACCPTVSVLFGARDEADKLPQALPTMLAQDYPRYEVIAVNDRSRDPTPQILDEFAGQHAHLKVVHVAELAAGWLGKPHALETAYRRATGEWLVFTDADVRFAPDLLRRTLALALEKRWDHVSLLAIVDLKGFWEKVAVGYWVLGFVLAYEPWRVSDPTARSYVGVGAFQLLRRSTYEAIGRHQRLALEVVDDMKLGLLVKRGGFRSGVAQSEDRLRVRWQEGIGNIVRGLTKNTFAALGYSVAQVAMHLAAIFVFSLLPPLALIFGTGAVRLLAGLIVGVAVVAHAAAAWRSQASSLYGLTYPLGALLFSYILLRSTVVTLWRGGVVWRDTFYPLDELRKGMV